MDKTDKMYAALDRAERLILFIEQNGQERQRTTLSREHRAILEIAQVAREIINEKEKEG